jgi:phosphoheptose isomerase
MDKADANNYRVGSFNGILVAPSHYNANSNEYVTEYTFEKLIGASGGIDDTCISIDVTDITGAVVNSQFNCL